MIKSFKLFEIKQYKIDYDQFYFLRSHDRHDLNIVGHIKDTPGGSHIFVGFVIDPNKNKPLLDDPFGEDSNDTQRDWMTQALGMGPGYYYGNFGMTSTCYIGGRDWNYIRKAKPEEIKQYYYYKNLKKYDFEIE